jgi:hypothetical protein
MSRAALSPHGGAATRRLLFVLTLLVGFMTLSWILATPPSAGPDEPGHLVRGAALVRGELTGERGQFGAARRGFEVPAWVGFPDPACFAFQPYTPAICATSLPRPTGEAVLGTRASEYPVWGHVLAGVGTLSPSPAVSVWLSRSLEALVPILLLGAAFTISVRRGRLAAAATLFAVTPMAWFMFAVVNPSSMAVAGGVALWVAVSWGAATSWHRWVVAAGWAALVLPRRDGLIWACVIVAAVAVLERRSVWSWWQELQRGPQALIGVSTAITLAWAATSDSRVSQALVVAPLVLVVAEAGRRAWDAVATDRVRVMATATAAAIVGAIATVLVIDRRPGGFDADLMVLVIGRTGEHLTEAIGVLGWLDTPIPVSMVLLWLVGLGILASAAVQLLDSRLLAAAVSIVAFAIVASWVMEMYSGNTSGTYWQGRYYLPLLVGVPIVLGGARLPLDVERRLAMAVAAIAVVVVNVALAAAVRRWAVGLGGSLYPWQWHTYRAPVHPGVLIVVHAVASCALVERCLRGWPRTDTVAAA